MLGPWRRTGRARRPAHGPRSVAATCSTSRRRMHSPCVTSCAALCWSKASATRLPSMQSPRVAARNLADDGIRVVPIGGATSIRGFIELFGPRRLGVRLAGLCDAGEERSFLRGLERAGLGVASRPGECGGARVLRVRGRSRGRADPSPRAGRCRRGDCRGGRPPCRGRSSRSSPLNGAGPTRSSCAGSWAPAAGARCSTRVR